MDFLSQVFVRRDLAVRRGLFLFLTALMLLTGFSRPTNTVGWWEGAVQAPQVTYLPEAISSHHHFVEVTVTAEQSLAELEISVDAGTDWVPVRFLTGTHVNFNENGKDAHFEFSLQVGHLAHFLAPAEVGQKGVRSLLLRGVTRQGVRTAPKSLAFIYGTKIASELSVEGPL